MLFFDILFVENNQRKRSFYPFDRSKIYCLCLPAVVLAYMFVMLDQWREVASGRDEVYLTYVKIDLHNVSQERVSVLLSQRERKLYLTLKLIYLTVIVTRSLTRQMLHRLRLILMPPRMRLYLGTW